LLENCPARADILKTIYVHGTNLNLRTNLASDCATLKLQFAPRTDSKFL
jgi:hypothetical protein